MTTAQPIPCTNCGKPKMPPGVLQGPEMYAAIERHWIEHGPNQFVAKLRSFAHPGRQYAVRLEIDNPTVRIIGKPFLVEDRILRQGQKRKRIPHDPDVPSHVIALMGIAGCATCGMKTDDIPGIKIWLGMYWIGVPWPKRKPRPKLGRAFPWLLQPTEEHNGCGCLLRLKATYGVLCEAIGGVFWKLVRIWKPTRKEQDDNGDGNG